MRRVITILFTILTGTLFTINAQTENIFSHINYALTISSTNTGSGHGTNYAVNFNAQDKSRMFEAGVLYDKNKQRVKGAELKYKWFAAKNNDMLNTLNIKPFVMYNLIYQTEIAKQATIVNSGGETYVIENEEEGTVATMEHYVGVGLIAKIGQSFYAETSAGLGTYIGSIDKVKKPGTFGIHKENKGYTSTFKLGLGYLF